MTKYLLFLMTLVFVFYGAANADFYKWEDETGAVHITDYPPPDKSSKKVEVHKDQGDNTSTQQGEEEQEAPFKDSKSKKNKKPEVTLYTKDECKDCDNAREFLKSKKISFKEYNMDKDKDAVAQRKEIDNSEDVPFAIINRTQVYGFSESVYNRALQLTP
jgi:Glutaredoxin and related proteins